MRAPFPNSRSKTRDRFAVYLAAVFAAAGFTGGCAASLDHLISQSPPRKAGIRTAAESEVYARADDDRTIQLEVEVERLREDLREAEESLVAIESGLRGFHGRADAVSALAETRIEVERAARRAPWSVERVAEARLKLGEAERQLQAGHSGSAVFFASRARRIASGLNNEARRVAATEGLSFIRGRRVNLRAGPSTDDKVRRVLVGSTPVVAERRDGEWRLVRTIDGMVGWIHESLLRKSVSPSAQTKTQSLPASFAP